MAKAKKTKAEDYSSMDVETLSSKIADEEVRLKKLRFSHAVNPIENPLSIRYLRRAIAKMKTLQTQKTKGL